MKKNLLLAAAALFAGSSAFAQAIVFDGEAVGLNADAVTEVAAGTVLGSNDAVEVTAAFTDSYKIVGLTANGYSTINIDGTDISLATGIQGNTNPKDGEGGNPATTLTAPVGGAVLQLNVKKDGYVVVWGKLSSNKNYTIFEDGVSPIGYKLAMQTNSTLGNFSIEVQGEGEYNYVTSSIAWPEVIFTGDEASAVKAGGDGILVFPVYEGLKYYVNACGSKISAGGVYFSETDKINVSLSGDEAETVALLVDGATAAISTINGSSKVASVKIYNVSGQEIKSLVKGINIVKRTMTDGSVQCVKVLNK
jgi:hypothetical protein